MFAGRWMGCEEKLCMVIRIRPLHTWLNRNQGGEIHGLFTAVKIYLDASYTIRKYEDTVL